MIKEYTVYKSNIVDALNNIEEFISSIEKVSNHNKYVSYEYNIKLEQHKKGWKIDMKLSRDEKNKDVKELT